MGPCVVRSEAHAWPLAPPFAGAAGRLARGAAVDPKSDGGPFAEWTWGGADMIQLMSLRCGAGTEALACPAFPLPAFALFWHTGDPSSSAAARLSHVA